MKLNKYIINVLKGLFVIGVFYLIYISISTNENLDKLREIRITKRSFLTISIVVLLQFLNWFIEAIKFRYILSKKELISVKESLKSVYVGNATGILTPDRLGNFIGRFLYLKNKSKSLVTSSTLLGNFTQLIATVTFALIGITLHLTINSNIIIPIVNEKVILLFNLILWLSLIYLYFNPTIYLRLIFKIKWMIKYKETINYLKSFSKKESIHVLIYSHSRYSIFIVQLYLILNTFGLEIPLIEVIIFTGLLYLITTLIPSPLFGNLGTREYISILLLSSYSHPEIALIASLAIWIINIALPSIIGSYLLFRMNHDHHKV